MIARSTDPFDVEREPLTGEPVTPGAPAAGSTSDRERPQPREHLLNMVKVAVFVVAAFYAIGVCWPAQAASPSSSSTRNAVSTTKPGSTLIAVPTAFPTGEFPKMDFMPKSQEAEPRPHITRVDGGDFDDDLVNPTKLPTGAPSSEGVLPKPSASLKSLASSKTFKHDAIKNLTSIIKDNSTSKCERCRKALRVGQTLARANPSVVPDIMVELCKTFKYTTKPTVDIGCERKFATQHVGGVLTQVLSYADFSEDSSSADYMCAAYIQGKSCPFPEMKTLSSDFLNKWFNGTTKAPSSVVRRSKKVGDKREKPLRVFHGSDYHVDPRYLVGSEGNCDNGQCCRADSYNSTLWNKPEFDAGSIPTTNISHPADYWGYFKCDSPWSLIASAMQGLSALQRDSPLDLALYTGDLTTHDEDWHISRDLVKYSEQSLFDMFHHHMPNTTMVVALGNHDSAPSDNAVPNSLPDGRADQLSWDWDNVAKLIKSEGWGNDSTAQTIRSHYGGYSISPRKGLRVISINTDMWYHNNPFVYLNMNHPDPSHILRWLTDELQAAEDANERAWVVGHVLSGWDGGDAIDNPTNLLYHIMSRYSHTIAHAFFGHKHEDEFQIWYEMSNGNSSSVSRKTQDARAMAFIAPSVTPLSNVNPSLRVYEVDPETYEVMDYEQYYTQLYGVDKLNGTRPSWNLLYTARDAYANFSASQAKGTYAAPVQLDDGVWPKGAPLNASFWAALTDEMEARPELIEMHQLYQGRNSPRSPACDTEECQKAKLCYMRSASSNLGRHCPSGFGSVQSF